MRSGRLWCQVLVLKAKSEVGKMWNEVSRVVVSLGSDVCDAEVRCFRYVIRYLRCDVEVQVLRSYGSLRRDIRKSLGEST